MYKIVTILFFCLCNFCFCSCGKIIEEDEKSSDKIEKIKPKHSGGTSSTSGPTSTQKGYDENHPLSVSEFSKSNYGDAAVWVVGYIVGDCKKNIKYAEWEPPFSYDSSILLADVSGETDADKVMSVQLVTASMKNDLGLIYHPELKGKKLLVLGAKQTYLGLVGIKKYIGAYTLLDQ